MMSAVAPLVLTMGEPGGIGAELALKAWAARRESGVPTFALIDDRERVRDAAGALGLTCPVEPLGSIAEADALFLRALPVLPLGEPVDATPGLAEPRNAGAVIASIERAVALVRAGEAAALVTNPIQKQSLYQAGFRHPGHTEFLAALAGGGVTPVMMLACEALRVVPVTIHLPLAEAVRTLSRAAIEHCGRVTAAALQRDFALPHPRLAVAGLNPHAGEAGGLGREEIELIAPAVERLKAEGIAACGPLPADTLFHAAARERYDAALCMYHDQALIPLKTIDFDGGVNVTLGLPFVRTSPDHGTALDIAGKGAARPTSLIAALRLARRMADARAAKGDHGP
jgi:4-hydroxythreonine-4-phosphate dehydrogenase